MGRQAEVVLQARISREDLGFPFVPVEIKRNAIKFPITWEQRADKGRGQVIAIHEFEPESVMNFYMRYRNNGANPAKASGDRVTQPLGKDAVAAYTQFRNFEADFERVRRGLAPITTSNTNGHGSTSTSKSIAAASQEFLESKAIIKGRAVESYERAQELFLEFCGSRYRTLAEIDGNRQVMLQFVAWLKQNLQRRAKGHPDNTYRNKLKDLRVFHNFHKITMGLPSKEWPKEKKKRKEKYSTATINAFLNAAGTGYSSEADAARSRWTKEDDKDLVLFLLQTGFRDDEVAHAQYKDIDFKGSKINIDVKPEFVYGGQPWTPKNGHAREQSIDLDARFVKRMKNRIQRYNAGSGDLIFPNTANKPDQRLIRVIQRLAKQVGYEKAVELHKFRKTFGTIIADQQGLEKARIWLGHEDIATTSRYIAADWDETDAEKQKKITKTWEAVGD